MLEKVKQIKKNYKKMCQHAIKQITFLIRSVHDQYKTQH